MLEATGDALRKDADLSRERIRCERIEAEAREIREQAEALQAAARQTDSKRETRSDTEIKRLKDERDRVKQQLERVAKQNQAAERDAAEAKAAQRDLETQAADDRRAFERQLEKQKADYDALVSESARIGLNERRSATHATDSMRPLLKTEPKLGFGDVGKSDAKNRDERQTRSRTRRTTAAARAPSPDLYKKATGYSDDEDDEGEQSDGEDDVTNAKRRLGEG